MQKITNNPFHRECFPTAVRLISAQNARFHCQLTLINAEFDASRSFRCKLGCVTVKKSSQKRDVDDLRTEPTTASRRC